MSRLPHSKGARDRYIEALERRAEWLEETCIPRTRKRGIEPSFDLAELSALRWAIEICKTYGAAFDEVQREMNQRGGETE